MADPPWSRNQTSKYGAIEHYDLMSDEQMLSAVTYLRVSTKEQAQRDGDPEGYSIPAQREANRRKAASLGATIVEEYVDSGESARSADRPDLKRMLRDIRSQRIDFCIVHKVDRLARSRADDVQITMALKAAGVQLVSATENIDQTPSGILMHGIMSSIAEFYSANLANEVIKGMAQKVKSGGTPSMASLGYKNVPLVVGDVAVNTVVVDDERAPFVRRAFDLYATGDYSVAQLHALLADEGFETRPNRRYPRQAVSENTIDRLLCNPYYIGFVTFKGQTFQGRHEPLVSAETFQKAQDVRAERRRVGSRDRILHHYLKGGLLYCWRCQRLGMTSRLIYTEISNGRGGQYRYYLCRGRQDGFCDLPHLPVALVEREVEREVGNVALPSDLIALLGVRSTGRAIRICTLAPMLSSSCARASSASTAMSNGCWISLSTPTSTPPRSANASAR